MPDITPHVSDDPSDLDVLVSLVSGTARTEFVGTVRPISYRAPVWLLDELDALAQMSGKSRNHMITAVLSAGLEELRKRLPSDVAHQLNERTAEASVANAGQPVESIRE